MTFVAIAIIFIGVCAALGLRRQQSPDAVVAAALAAAVVCAQFVLLLTR